MIVSKHFDIQLHSFLQKTHQNRLILLNFLHTTIAMLMLVAQTILQSNLTTYPSLRCWKSADEGIRYEYDSTPKGYNSGSRCVDKQGRKYKCGQKFVSLFFAS